LFTYTAGAQCNSCKKNIVWLEVNNNVNMKTKSSLDNEIISKSNKYKIKRISKAFPYSKNELLMRLYEVEFEGDRNELDKNVNSSSMYKRTISLPEEENIELYTPSDYMWYLPTESDPNGWLWHLKRIQADKAWDITKGTPNIKVAVIDTWFDITHPDLENKFIYNYDPYDSIEFGKVCGKNVHGTIVSSLVAAKTDGGGQLASVGFNTMMIGYKAWSGSYLQRAQHASLALGVDIITSSAGGWSCTSTTDTIEKVAVQEILDNGTIVVMPAGNGPTGTRCYKGRERAFKPLSPEYDDRIIMVTSSGIDDKHQYFEAGIDKTHSHFQEVDVCSPGYNIFGAMQTTDKYCNENTWPYYGSCTGTSFATPIVAGICALMKSIDPCLTPAKAQEIIKSTTDPILDANLFTGLIGTGRVNAYKAVKEVGTKYYYNDIISGNKTISAGYGFDFSNTSIGIASNIKLIARKEVTINKGFEVPLGSTLEIVFDETVVNSCEN